MTAVLRANLRAEIAGGLGIRPQRISLRPATTDLLLPRQPEVLRKPRCWTGPRRQPMRSRPSGPGGRSDSIPLANTAGQRCCGTPWRPQPNAVWRRLPVMLFGSMAAAAEQRPGRGRNGHPQPS